MTVTVLNSTAIEVEWSPPQTPNGIIVYYTIYINNNSVIKISATGGDQSTVVNGLAAFETVTVSITASTRIGEGPVSLQQNVATHESGEYRGYCFLVPHYIYLHNYCSSECCCKYGGGSII